MAEKLWILLAAGCYHLLWLARYLYISGLVFKLSQTSYLILMMWRQVDFYLSIVLIIERLGGSTNPVSLK